MRLVPRLIPALIAAATVMLTFRIGLVWRDAGMALAQGEPVKPGSAASQPAAAPPASAAPASAAPAEGSPPAADDQASDAARPKPSRFTPAEVEILQELSKRRTELDQRQEDQERRELTLKAVEQRVDEKIAELKDMQAKIDAAAAKAEAQDNDKIKSLVHIYENMKPKDAATILEAMDMPSLLQLLTRMKDLKTAPILAAMAPEKAAAVTIAMAKREDLPDQKTN
jgi:flagellar motility protein MotE (MotC chaperone)